MKSERKEIGLVLKIYKKGATRRNQGKSVDYSSIAAD
tara:strand:- start:689 stop:799 length:111 start_codon:yes stop_codon:yes gene_type:complete